MNKTGWSRRSLVRAVVALGVAALAAGLPLAVELSSPQDALRSVEVMAGAGDTLLLSQSIALLPTVPLFLDGGLFQSVDATGVKPGEFIEKLRIDRAVFRIPLAPGQARSAPVAQSLQPLVSHLASLNAGRIELRNSRIDFITAAATVSLTDISADLTPSRKGATTFKVTATFKGQPVRFEGAWTLPEAKPQSGAANRAALKVSVASSHLDGTLDGRLGLDGLKFQGTAELQVRSLRTLARWFGLAVPPSSNLRDAKLSSPIEWSNGQLTFAKAVIIVDGSEGVGALSLETQGARPAINGTLAFNVFDVRPHIEAILQPARMAPGQKSNNGSTLADGSLVSEFDADLRLSANKVVLPRVESGRGAISITLKQGEMRAEVAELELEGGSVNGQISLDVKSEVPRLAIKGRLDGVDPGRIFAADLKRNPLFGRANIAIDGSGTGHEFLDMIAVFSGKGTFALVEGGRLGLDLKALSYAAQKANRVGWSASGKGSTTLDQLDARFQYSNGALSFEALQAKAGNNVLVGRGKIDVRGRLFDLDVATMPGTASATAPEAAAETSNVLAFRGPWADPAISLLGRPFTQTAPAFATVPAVKGATMLAPFQAPAKQ